MEDKVYRRKSKDEVKLYDIYSNFLESINVKNEIGVVAYNILEGKEHVIQIEDIDKEYGEGKDRIAYDFEVLDKEEGKEYSIKKGLNVYYKEGYTVEDIFRENWDEGLLRIQKINKVMEKSKEHYYTDIDYVYTELVGSYGKLTRILKEKFRIIQTAFSYKEEVEEIVRTNSLTNIGLSLANKGYKIEESDNTGSVNYLILEGCIQIKETKEFSLEIIYDSDTGAVSLNKEDLMLDFIKLDDSIETEQMYINLRRIFS